MKLILFPGLGSPESINYSYHYRVLFDGEKSNGYDEVDFSLRYPGHSKIGKLSWESSIDAAIDFLKNHENSEYDVLTTSFGSILCGYLSASGLLKNVRRQICWWLPSYWQSWAALINNRNEFFVHMNEKGKIIIDDNFFNSIHPFESSVLNLKNSVKIVGGENDINSPPSFHQYLKLIVKGQNVNQNISFYGPIKNTPHNFNEGIPAQVLHQVHLGLFGLK